MARDVRRANLRSHGTPYWRGGVKVPLRAAVVLLLAIPGL